MTHRPLIALFLLSAACQGDRSPSDDLEVETEINLALDFTVYERFEIVDPAEELYEDPPGTFEDARLATLAAIEEEATRVGLIRDPDAHQLRIAPYVAIEPTDDFVQGFYGYYWGYDFAWAGLPEHEVGTLVLDVVDIGDPADEDDDVLAYRGIVTGARGKSIEGLRRILRRALIEVFDAWPV